MMDAKIVGQAAAGYETPFYLFDLDSFQKRTEQIREILGPGIYLCYAIKANPFLTQTASRCVNRLEVCSPGEFAICERAGIPMEQIVLSGVYKEEKEIRRVMARYGEKGIYTAESLRQYQLLAKTAEDLGVKISVLLRLTSGNQFGMDEETIHQVIRDRKSFPRLQIRGLQYYSGTQKRRKKILAAELEKLDRVLRELKELWGYEAAELEYGPGFFVPYFQKDEVRSTEEEMDEFRRLLGNMKFSGRITLEMGRYLAAECGCYVTRIVDEKTNEGRHYGIVDGGIHHLNYFGQTMAMKVPYYQQMDGKTMEYRGSGEKVHPVTLCGALCTVSDVLVKNLPLKGEILGDLLVFEKTGAYSVTEGIHLFLSRNFPLILFYSKEAGLRLVRGPIESSRFNSTQ